MKKRVSKFELLRIIAMYLIVLHHSIVHGVLNVEINSELKYPSATILAEKEGIKYGIQCKCYASDIGNKAVQEAFAGKTYYNCHVAAVLTNRHFTKSAKELSEANKVLLWDREKLEEFIQNANLN